MRAPGGHKGPPRGLRKTKRRFEKETKALIVIGSLCPISVEGQHREGEYERMYVRTYICTDGRNEHPYVMR
jgi:hypothetical protein